MKNQVKRELLELAQNIVEQGDNMDFITIYFKTRLLYEKAAVMNYLERTGETLSPKEQNIPSPQPATYHTEPSYSPPPQAPQKVVTPPSPPPVKLPEIKEEKPIEEYLSRASDVVFEDKREPEKKRSLNDNFTKSTKIGLNDRIAFVKHLFDGNETAFYNTLKKVDEAPTVASALQFVKSQIKPQYNDWKGKEAYEERFMGWVVNKFD